MVRCKAIGCTLGGAAMTRTIHINIQTMDKAQVAEIKALAEADTAGPEIKKLAQAVVELNQSVRDLRRVLRTIANSGALHVTK